MIGEALVKRQAETIRTPRHRDAMHNHQRNESRNKHVGLAVIGLLIGMLGNSPLRGEPFVAKQEPLSDQVWQDMRGKSWKPNQGCASRDRLVLLTVPFRDFAGRPTMGELVVAKSVAAVLARIFTEIYDSAAFRIARMERVDKYGGSDTASMAATIRAHSTVARLKAQQLYRRMHQGSRSTSTRCKTLGSRVTRSIPKPVDLSIGCPNDKPLRTGASLASS
jgi:hypothetical protein